MSHINKFFELLLLLIFLVAGSKADSFSCNRVFTKQYSFLIFNTRSFISNKIPMVLNIDNKLKKGMLVFNMCEDIQLTNICSNIPVIGKYIFVANETKEGESKCFVFEPHDAHSWKYETLSLPSKWKKDNSYQGVILNHSLTNVWKTAPLTHEIISKLDKLDIQLESSNKEFNNLEENLQNDIEKKNFIDLLQNQKLTTSKNATENKLNIDNDPSSEKNKISKFKKINIKDVLKYKENQMNGDELISDISSNTAEIHEDEQTKNHFEIRSTINHLLKENLKLDKTQVVIKHIFFCYVGNEPYIQSNFMESSNTLLVKIFSKDGCMIQLYGLQLMSEYNIITSIIFISIGILTGCFGVLKYNYSKLLFSTPFIFSYLFITYFLYIEYYSQSIIFYVYLIGLSIVTVMISIVSYFKPTLFYIGISFVASNILGVIIKYFLELIFYFFRTSMTEWVFIPVIFLGFVFLTYFSEQYFAIISSSIIGSFFLSLSLKYMKFTDYDFLLNIQMYFFEEFKFTKSENNKFSFMFLIFLIIFILIQIVAKYFYDKNMDEIDHLNKSGIRRTVNIANI